MKRVMVLDGVNWGKCATCGSLVGSSNITQSTGNCYPCEIDRLQAALRHIAETCINDPDTAQFACRVLDGSATISK